MGGKGELRCVCLIREAYVTFIRSQGRLWFDWLLYSVTGLLNARTPKNPILLQWGNIEEALYNYCVLNLAFSFFFCFFFLTKITSFWTFTQSRSALKTFCLFSNNAAPEILTRLISNKCFIFANGRFSRRLLRRNTGGLQIILKSFTVKLIRL